MLRRQFNTQHCAPRVIQHRQSRQFLLRQAAEPITKFNTQNSTLPKATIQHSTLNIQHCVYDAKSWAMRFLWIKVGVSHYQCPRISTMQFLKQPSQRLLLCLRPCVARSLAVIGKTSYICNPNRMAVMISTMRTNALLRSSTFDGPVGRNHIMIPTPLPSQWAVIAVNIRHSQCAARLIGGAMHNNQCYRSHKSTNNSKFLLRQAAEPITKFLIE